ncbi:hypothetical protein Tco_1367897 [Tanacetum coccineum]
MMGMVLSHTGILYYMNMCSGIVKYDLKIQPYQNRGVHEYIDVGDDGESPYLYSFGLKKVVILNKEHVLLVPKGIFKELRIKKDEDEWFLTQDEGKIYEKAGENIFIIKRTEWSCVGNDWSLRYSTINLLDKSMRVCKVRYARTADKFAQLCNRLGLRDLRDDRMMKRAISETKKIHLLYPKKSNKELSRVREAYKNSRGLFNVVKLLLVESVGEFNYFAFEGFVDNLATFIKYHSESE